MTCGSEPDAETMILAFESQEDAQFWLGRLRRLLDEPRKGSPEESGQLAEGVCLIRGAPEVPHQSLGWGECSDTSTWAADRGLQLRAALRGADAVLKVSRRKQADLDGPHGSPAGWPRASMTPISGSNCVGSGSARKYRDSPREWPRSL